MATVLREQGSTAPSTAGARRKLRVLFVAEAVTLAHVARPAALFGCLDPEMTEPMFATDLRSRRFLNVDSSQYHSIKSIDSSTFAARLDRGLPVYRTEELRDYVRADLTLIDKTRPDLIVGDFRLSLSISARVAQVPYACITNSYWSPYAAQQGFPLPVLPWTAYVPLGFAQRAFDAIQPWVLAPHCRPLNTVRADYGMPSLSGGLRSLYTDADHVLYADAAHIFPVRGLPTNHHHLGPIPWSPPTPLPAWWHDMPTDKPILYLTMGSSGHAKTLNSVIDSLADMNVNVMAATVGVTINKSRHRNLWHSDYLPGGLAAAKSAVVICNGGSPTSQQALAAGKPVIGICWNMDQMLNMRGVAAAGPAGMFLRSDRLSRAHVRAAVLTSLRRASTPAVEGQSDQSLAVSTYVDHFQKFIQRF